MYVYIYMYVNLNKGHLMVSSHLRVNKPTFATMLHQNLEHLDHIRLL